MNNESQVSHRCKEVVDLKMEMDRMTTVVLDQNWKYQCEITDLIYRETWINTWIQMCVGIYIYVHIYVYEYEYTYTFPLYLLRRPRSKNSPVAVSTHTHPQQFWFIKIFFY